MDFERVNMDDITEEELQEVRVMVSAIEDSTVRDAAFAALRAQRELEKGKRNTL